MRILTFISLVLLSFQTQAQFSQQYNQYMFNGMVINPAYTGIRECLSVTGIHSNQWVGFDGAPTTNSLTAHTPFRKKGGLGLNFFTDKLGVQSQSGIYGSYAYHLKINAKSKLSFGMNAGVSFFEIRDKEIVIIDDDPVFMDQKQTRSFPNIGAGLFYYRDAFYAGLSTPTLFSSEYSNIANNKIFHLNPNALVIMQTSGGIIDIGDNVKWKPSYLVKFIPKVTTAFDLNSNFYYKERVNLGMSYRIKRAFVVMAGVNIKDKLDIGYSYSYPLTDISNYSSGTHEIMLRYEFKEVVSSVNPRLY